MEVFMSFYLSPPRVIQFSFKSFGRWSMHMCQLVIQMVCRWTLHELDLCCCFDSGWIFVTVAARFLFMIRLVVSLIVYNPHCSWRFNFTFWFFQTHSLKMIFYSTLVANDTHSLTFGGFVGPCITTSESCVFLRWSLFRFRPVALFFLLSFLWPSFFSHWFCACGGDFLGKSLLFNLSWIFVSGLHWSS